MQYPIEEFFHFVRIERGLSNNTIQAYKRDLSHYYEYIKEKQKITSWQEVGRHDVLKFIYMLNDQGKSAATCARMLSTLRLFHQFLIREYQLKVDPSLHIETPKANRKLPKVLSPKDIDKLLDIPDTDRYSIRNKAC